MLRIFDQRSHQGLIILFGFLFISLLPIPSSVEAASKYWIGPAGGNVSDNANWSTTSGGSNDTTAPGSSDVAIFDGGNNNNAFFNSSFGGTIDGIQVSSTYAGTVTLQRSISLVSGHFIQAGGTFSLGSSTMTMGTNASTLNFTVTGGTFDSASGTLALGGTGTQTYTTSGELNLYNLTINKAAGTVTIATTTALVVTNNFNFTNMGNAFNGSGYIEMRGATTTVGTGGSGNLVVRYLISGDQSIVSSGGSITGLLINKPSGTVFQNGALSVSAGGFSLQSGTYNLVTSTITIGTNATGANFTVTSGTLSMTTGGLAFGSLGPSLVTVPTSLAVYDLTVNKGAGTVTVSSSQTLVVTNSLTLTNGTVDGPGFIEMQGTTTTVASGSDGGNLQIKYLVGGDQTINSSSGGRLPGIIINKASGTLYQAGPMTIDYGDFLLQGGTYSLGTSTLTVGPNTASAVDFTITGGTFDAGTGSLLVAGNGSNLFDVPTSQTFYNFQVNKPVGTMTVSSSDRLVISGTLNLTDGVINGGTFEAQGDVTVSSTANGGTVALAFSGSANQNYTDNGGTKTTGNITINKSAGEVKLLTAMDYDSSGQTITIATGTLNLNGFNLVATGTLSVNSGGTLKWFGSETITRGSLSLATSSTVIFNGNGNSASTSYILTTLSTNYGNLIVSSTDAGVDTFTISSSSLTVRGSFSITTGTVAAGTSTLFIGGDWSNTGTFNAGSSTVNFNGTNQTISGSSTFYHFTKTVTSSATLTFEQGMTQTILGTWTVSGTSSQLLALRSSSSGAQWRIDPQGTRSISYLDVKDSYNINASTIAISGLSLANSGNNTGWGFFSITSVTGQNPQTTAGGRSITINGANFVTSSTISINGSLATGVVFVSSTQLTGLAPANTAGVYDVIVADPSNQTSSCASCMTYIAPPTISSIDEIYSSTAGGQTRTITGLSMLVGVGGIKIDTATTTTSGTSSSISFTTPAHSPGNVVVRVYGTSGTDDNGIYIDSDATFMTYEVPPSVSTISPTSSLSTTGGTTITVTGTSLKIGSGGGVLDPGGTADTLTTSGTPSSLTFVTPAHSAGTVSVRFFSENGTVSNGLYTDYASLIFVAPSNTTTTTSTISGRIIFVPMSYPTTSTVAITSPTPPPASTQIVSQKVFFSFSRDLSFGMSGLEVTLLQVLLVIENSGPSARALLKNGFTNYFGLLTKSAVQEFQNAQRITPTNGTFGPKTRAVMNEVLRRML